LSKILSKILKDIYPIHKDPLENRLIAAAALKEALQRWREDISSFVGIQFSAVNEFYRRQIFALQLTYAHTVVLLNRPFLFDNYAQEALQYSETTMEQCDNNVNTCLNAAMEIVKLINLTYNSTSTFKTSWVSLFDNSFLLLALINLSLYITAATQPS
jgi:hypothetical protein